MCIVDPPKKKSSIREQNLQHNIMTANNLIIKINKKKLHIIFTMLQ